MQQKWWWLVAGMLWVHAAGAQSDSLSFPLLQLEDLLADREAADGFFDFNTLGEGSGRSRRKPLDLNAADQTDLRESGLFSEAQILRFLAYRDQAGPLLSLYELQAVPGFDLAFIRQLLPFVTVHSELDDLHLSAARLFTQGRRALYLRWRRQLEADRGFRGEEGADGPAFEGDPNQLYLRFRHSYENRFSIGFTAEKDPGEALFAGSNPQGFDFLSAHAFLRNYNRWLKALALGDFSVRFGEGLILNNGFAYGKSPASMDIRRGGRSLSPFTSINEALFFRGAAATLAPGRNWEITCFGSTRRRDANRTGDGAISAFQLSGLHRTASEIEDKKAVRQKTLGLRIRRTLPRGHFALNVLRDRLDKPLLLSPQLYNRFYFQGDRLFNTSADYSWRLHSLHFFGETAWSRNGALATVNGLQATLDPRADLALVFRHYPRHFQTLHGAPFAETSGVRNETGLYAGLEFRPRKGLRLNGYLDLWRHPWLRFQTDAPSSGHEWLLRLTIYRKRKWEAYWQLRGENKERNNPFPAGRTNQLAERQVFFSRWHFSIQLNKMLEWRTRLEMGRFRIEGIPGRQTGMLFYQDFLFRPVGSPLSFTTRFGLFDTDGYDVRFYAYENGLLYNFGIPAYYDRGSRFYLNIRYKGIRNLTFEARYAQSFYPGKSEIGTGQEATPGDRRSELGFQVKWQF